MREHSNTEPDPEQTTVEQTSPTARASTPLHLQQTIVLVCTLKIPKSPYFVYLNVFYLNF